MNTTDMCIQHNEEVRYKYERLEKAVHFLVELKTNYDPKEADKFVQEFGFDMLNWTRELLEYWSKDEDMQYHTEDAFKPKDEDCPQEYTFTDLMRAGASYGMMSAWDMSRASGKPWCK